VSSLTVVFIDVIVPHVPRAWEAALSPRFLVPEGDASLERQRELEALLGRVAAHWPDNPYELRLVVVHDEELNAVALPGGTVVVTSGLVGEAATENELAFVLGHELGHFRYRDHLRGLGRGVVIDLMTSAVLGDGSLELVAIAERFALRTYDRRQERAADAFGLELVHAEYGHVYGATDFFKRLPAAGGVLGRTTEAYLSTHPVSSSRVEELARLARERGWPTDGEPTPWPVRAEAAH
jgi:predicted Zn-dependent protease